MIKKRTMAHYLISPEVKDALDDSSPVVALETAFLTHGLPQDLGIRVMHDMMKECRRKGAIPAPVCVSEGVIRIGMDMDELSGLVENKGRIKVASRDLPFAMMGDLSGGTTVSATLRIAMKANIEVMATGGIGGVHPALGNTTDISQDLIELSRCPILIVCSGPKSILDIRSTYEMLETLSVPVASYASNELPGFFSGSGIASEWVLNSPDEVCEAYLKHRSFTTGSSFLIANPIPEDSAMDRDHIRSLLEGLDHSCLGKARTPEALLRLAGLTGGDTLDANRALLLSNAGLASDIAVELSVRKIDQI